jgi:hypothetical protein
MAPTDYRSVFLPIVRDLVPASLDLFDYAEPSLVTGKRDVTTVPSQALYLMNDAFVIRAADSMARRLFDEVPSGEERVDFAFKLAYGRTPTTNEKEKARQFFNSYQSISDTNNPEGKYNRGSAWSSFCQALLCSAEFRYLD